YPSQTCPGDFAVDTTPSGRRLRGHANVTRDRRYDSIYVPIHRFHHACSEVVEYTYDLPRSRRDDPARPARAGGDAALSDAASGESIVRARPGATCTLRN